MVKKHHRSDSPPESKERTVSAALATLGTLRRSAPGVELEQYPTGNIGQGAGKVLEVEDKLSSESIPASGATSATMSTIPTENVNAITALENNVRAVELDLKEELAGLRGETWKSSAIVSSSISAVVAAVLVSLVIYFHSDLKDAINKFETRLSSRVEIIEKSLEGLSTTKMLHDQTTGTKEKANKAIHPDITKKRQ